MNSFYSGIIKYRKLIAAAFLVLITVCAMVQSRVVVDYDVMDYLPEDSLSTVSLRFMEKEFNGDIANARAVIRDVSKNEALKYKEKLEAIDGVKQVTWIDSLIPLDIPMDLYPEGLLDQYYKDRNAMFSLIVDDDDMITTVNEIYKVIGEDNMLCGQLVNTAVITAETKKDVVKICVIVGLALLLVLFLATTSWAEPFIIMAGLIATFLINSGTNIIFDKISFVTYSAGMILQLAVSLDYSVFLMNRFRECREVSGPEEAMRDALVLSTPAVLPSALTTAAGFAALASMKFSIGIDIGLALSKGVIVSLVTTLLFLPCITVMMYRLVEKTKHRSLLPSFRLLGKVSVKLTLPLCIVFALMIVPAYYASTHNSYLYGGAKVFGPDTRLGQDTKKIEEIFGESDTYALMVPRGNDSAEHAVVRELGEDERIRSVTAPVSVMDGLIPTQLIPESLISRLRTDDYDMIAISALVPVESERSLRLIEDVYAVADKYYPDGYYLAGAGLSIYDLKGVVESDMVRVNLIAVGAVFLILLIMMRSLLLPVILVLTIETSIWINLAISYITDTPLFYVVYLMISAVQLGATVDYAILYSERFKENCRLPGLGIREAAAKTVSDTAASVFTSAAAVSLTGFLYAVISSQRMIAQLGLLLGRGALCSLFAVLFVLPGLLMISSRINLRRNDVK